MFLIANVSTILQLVVSVLLHCMATLLVWESGLELLYFLLSMRCLKQIGFHCLTSRGLKKLILCCFFFIKKKKVLIKEKKKECNRK